MKKALLGPLFIATLFAQPVIADEAHHNKPEALVVAQAAAMSDGEIRKIDKAANKITLKHGPIANLDMPGMTMVFRVSDAAMLEQVKVGDKVRFTADKVDGNITVTKIEPAK